MSRKKASQGRSKGSGNPKTGGKRHEAGRQERHHPEKGRKGGRESPQKPQKAPRGNQTAEARADPRKGKVQGKADQERVFIGVSVDKE